jgi:hypothetical protein
LSYAGYIGRGAKSWVRNLPNVCVYRHTYNGYRLYRIYRIHRGYRIYRIYGLYRIHRIYRGHRDYRGHGTNWIGLDWLYRANGSFFHGSDGSHWFSWFGWFWW